MSKQAKTIFILGVVLFVAAVVTVIALTIPEVNEQTQDQPVLLVNKTINDVARVNVTNKLCTYSAWREGNGYTLEDIPPESLNIEYLGMLLDESSKIEYVREVGRGNFADYGLNDPEATVDIQYTDGQEMTLLLGDREQLSDGRYFAVKGGEDVYLMDNSRSIRFTMDIKKYIDYVIIPPRVEPSVMGAILDISFEGKEFEKPIRIRSIAGGDPEVVSRAASFGVTTHIMESPNLHGVDLTQANQIFGSLTGMITDGVLAYNCSQEELAKYGLNDPRLTVRYTYKNGKDATPEEFLLKVADYQGTEVMTKNDEGIVYTISEAPFTSASYEKLVAKRFLMPIILDVSGVEIKTPNETYQFELLGEQSKDLSVLLSGKPVDTALFRTFYNLLVSIDHDGRLVQNTKTSGEPILTITYRYRDKTKGDDTMEFYPGSLRRTLVSVNGVSEFETNEKFQTEILTELNKLIKETQQ